MPTPKNSLYESSPTISGIKGQCLGDSSQDAHQQTGQSSEHRLEDNPWCHDKPPPWLKWRRPLELNHLRAGDKPNFSSIQKKMKRMPDHPLHQSSKTQQKRLQRKSLNHLVKEQQKEHADIPTLMHTCVKN